MVERRKTKNRFPLGVWMGVLSLLILFPLVVKDPYSLHLANMMAIMAIMGLSVNLIFGYAGQIALGNAGFLGIGAYCSVLLEIHADMTFWLSTPIASLLAFTIGYLIGVPTLRLKHAYLAMATIAFNLIFDVVVTNWTNLTGGPTGLVNIPKVTFFYRPLVGAGYYYLCVSSVLLCLLLCSNLINSRVGRALLAIREQEEAASSLGVNTSHYKVVSFGLSAAFAAWAGSLHAHLLSFVSPEPFRPNYSILFLFMVVIGGKGSNMGAILGAIALTLLPEFLHGFEDYSLLVYGMVILVFLVFLPKGLIGLRYPIKELSLRVTRLRS